jgi:hypothetical protein
MVSYGGHLRHSGRALRRYADRHVIERATANGRLVTADHAAPHLGIRRSDVNHLASAAYRPRCGSTPAIIKAVSTPLVTGSTEPVYRSAGVAVCSVTWRSTGTRSAALPVAAFGGSSGRQKFSRPAAGHLVPPGTEVEPLKQAPGLGFEHSRRG